VRNKVIAVADVVALLLTAAATGLAAAHSSNLPDATAWTAGHPLPVAQVLAVAMLVLAQVGVVARDRGQRRNRELEDACREVAAYVDEQCPGLLLREVGVHIWTVAGTPFGRHLRRSGSFLLTGTRARSGIRWTQGRGVVGLAWRLKTRVIRDLERTRKAARSEQTFTALAAEDRLGLTWEEFVRTRQYEAVFAHPLFSRRETSAAPNVRGILTIDLTCTGHFEELRSAVDSSGFAPIVGLCETALEV
jgi:hypothetical protein